MSRDEAYQAGARAFVDGEERDDNPFPVNTPLYPSWDWGWTDMRDEQTTRALLEQADDERESA